MANALLELLTPGWSTSRPGDMKNGHNIPHILDAAPGAAMLFGHRHAAVASAHTPKPNPDTPQTDVDAW